MVAQCDSIFYLAGVVFIVMGLWINFWEIESDPEWGIAKAIRKWVVKRGMVAFLCFIAAGVCFHLSNSSMEDSKGVGETGIYHHPDDRSLTERK